MNLETDSLKKIQALAGAELSVMARLGYVALLLVAAGMTTVVVSLWSTEPSLPLRTQAAFGVMTCIGASWCALAVWALRTRRPLFARDRVIAGGMAVTFTSLFAIAGLAAVIVAGGPAAYGAFATGLVMLLIAIGVWVGARRRFAELAARRASLELALGR